MRSRQQGLSEENKRRTSTECLIRNWRDKRITKGFNPKMYIDTPQPIGCMRLMKYNNNNNKNAEVRGAPVTFMVRGQKMADRIIEKGLRVLGKHYKAEAFIEVRPDSICGACIGWGHGEHNCAFPRITRCALYYTGRNTGQNKLLDVFVGCVNAIELSLTNRQNLESDIAITEYN